MHTLRGTGLALSSMLCFALTYACYKASLPFLPPPVTIFFQSFFSWCILLPIALHHGLHSLLSKKLGLICLRSLLGLGTLYCISFALMTASLADVTLLNNTAPLFIPFIAWIWLREEINHKLWPSLILGFIGIVIILQPGMISIDQSLIFALLSGVFSACLIVVARRIAYEPFIRILFYYFLIFWLLTSPSLLFPWTTPPFHIWIYLVLASIFMITGQLSFSAALRHTPPQRIAPYLYSIVIFSGIIDWIVWQETPDLISIIGMGIVIISSIITITLSKKKTAIDAIVFVDPIGSGEPFKKIAHAMNYKIIAVFPHAKTYYTQMQHVSEESLYEDCDELITEKDFPDIMHKLHQSSFTIKACIAGNEEGVELAEQITAALKLPSNPIELSKARRDKGLIRQVLKKSGLSCPEFSSCSSELEVQAFARKHAFPLVIKTPKGSRTTDLFVCESLDELMQYFQKIMNTKNAFGQSAQNAVVEEFIEGKEYAVNTFSDGHQIHVTDVWQYDKIESAKSNNICYNTTFLPLTDCVIQDITSYAVQVAALFQVKKGPTHMKIKDDPKRGPTLIEIGAHLMGGGIPLMIQKHSNFDPYLSTIKVFTQGTARLPHPIIAKKYMVVASFPIPQDEKILGLEQIQKLPSYLHHTMNIHHGDHLKATSDLTTIPCHVFLAHSNKEQLLQDVDTIHELFSL
ncbi:MAG: EamA family transporter [Chlamydiae bacterium]|nr:EamA family transporter [Chlamydiota bacterium]